MDYTRFAVLLRSPLPSLTGLPRDRLLVRVGHPEALTLIRVLPPLYGNVIEALEDGLVEPLNLQQPVAAVLQMLAVAGGGYPVGLGPATPPTPPAHPRRLHLVRW